MEARAKTYSAISVPAVSGYHTYIKEMPEEKVRLANVTEKIRYVKMAMSFLLMRADKRLIFSLKYVLFQIKMIPLLVSFALKII